MTETLNSRFLGRNYLVVGGSSGIGLATAQRIASDGGHVLMVARRQEGLQKAHSSLARSGHRAIQLDASDEEAARNLMNSLRNDGIKIHGAVFCSGAHAVRPAKIARQSHYVDLIKSNLFSITNFVPGLLSLANQDAAVVLVSSAAVTRGGAAVSGYVTAKNAVIGLGRSLAAELAPKVRVNTVVPGVVLTPMTEGFFSTIGTAAVEEVKRRHPLGIGTADQVAAVICFLLSNEASWITGADIAVDGGFSIAG